MPAARVVKEGGVDGVRTSGQVTRARGIMPPGRWPPDRKLSRESTDRVKSVFGSSRGRRSSGVSRGRKGAAMRTRWKSSPLAPKARQQAKSIFAKEQHRRAMIISKARPLGGISSPRGIKEVQGTEVESPATGGSPRVSFPTFRRRSPTTEPGSRTSRPAQRPAAGEKAFRGARFLWRHQCEAASL